MVVIKLKEINNMKNYFNLDLKHDGKVIRMSEPFYTTREFVGVVRDLASALSISLDGEYEIALFVNEEYDNSVFFEKRKDYFENFCMIISEMYYVLDFFFNK